MMSFNEMLFRRRLVYKVGGNRTRETLGGKFLALGALEEMLTPEQKEEYDKQVIIWKLK